MEKMKAKHAVETLLQSIGVAINGNNAWDIQVFNDDFYESVLSGGSLALGESFMEKWWDCQQLDLFFTKMLRAKLESNINVPLRFKLKQILAKIINLQSKHRAKKVAYKHYDLGNDLFTNMLDKQMVYSCGYWKEANTLEEAQLAKFELVCQKLQLKPGMTLLDIGCGFGGLAKYAALQYDVNVVGITISKQQYDYAKMNCQHLPIEIRLQDYREINQKFERVVSIGMFEHVGHKNYSTFMKKVHNVLADDGLFLLHTIGTNKSLSLANEWITTYIFPNGALPSTVHISKTAESFFVMEDWHNFGAHYDKTIMAWYDNFIRNWSQLSSRYDERFYRMWSYYLLSCAASFRARTNQLWQVVFSKRGVLGGYNAPR